ncbi:hypothetical protein V6N12_029761 [Hibiscus sabdariffa]|uniref:Secreted protein n=1 Tax=Hibiscus sabdariffa TaxID=183260 RepID=A0ABR2CX55_9ROSI
MLGSVVVGSELFRTFWGVCCCSNFFLFSCERHTRVKGACRWPYGFVAVAVGSAGGDANGRLRSNLGWTA